MNGYRFCGLRGKEDWDWITARVPLVLTDSTSGILALDDEIIKGAVVFDNWTENSVQVHFALDTPYVIRHGLFEEVSRFVFKQSGRGIMIGLVPGDNEKALKLDLHIGFELVYSVKDGIRRLPVAEQAVADWIIVKGL